jgi:homoserine kinase
LYAVIVHPKVELRTELSRNVLKKQVELKQAIRQWGNVAGLIAGLYSSDYDLIGRSLEDFIVEPVRALLIPGYNEVTSAAKTSGALGCGISGSGPSIFSLCKGKEQAEKVGKAMSDAAFTLNLQHDLHVSPIAKNGCRII